MERLNRVLLIGAIACSIGACASSSDEISATYVSPIKYHSYKCTQLEQEYARLLQETTMTNKKQDDIASNDSVAMAVGLILFWPALFFIDSDDKREDVGRLKGEVKALEQASIQKDCTTLAKTMVKDKAVFAKAKEEALKKRAAADDPVQ